jgi:predicted PhzF superfamily epimerase YddE/YHI9
MSEDKLNGVFKGSKLKAVLAKKAVIVFRATDAEKADMQATAKGLGLSLTEYIGRLHALARAQLK